MNREDIEARYGEAYDTDEMEAAFEVVGFLAPFAEVVRKSDGARGTLRFQHDPRLYYGFRPS